MRLPHVPLRRAATAVTAAAALALTTAPPSAAAGHAPLSLRGVHPTGATYAIEVPADWNGTVLAFSPGYGQGAGDQQRPAELGGNAAARQWLLDRGYALAGTRPYGDGWAVEETLRDSAATLAVFAAKAGKPKTALAWGSSMGGNVAAGLAERRPDLVDGALPYCASVAGPVAMLNQSLDAAFAFTTLLAPGTDDITLARLGSADAEARTRAAAGKVLETAQQTPQGRARIALAAAFAQVSTWSVPGTPEPADDDWAGQQEQQYAAFMPTVFSPRFPLEQRAGGNMSWNDGVDYREQLRQSGNARQVRALYEAAGLDLDADLARLDREPRISADPGAVAYMERNFTPDGELDVPVLTLHERGDNFPTVTQARAYSDAVRRAGDGRMLRQAFVDRPGHCGYTGAELVATALTLERRVKTGRWGADADAPHLGRLAERLAARDPELGTAQFVRFRPDRFLRPHVPGDTR
ncbi:alpha/beta hydrolase [Actinomadura bangladeshensis]|uniref:Alpha/beta hydrolase n=1 Tax=Actinomadura bangladeshensis TaxID=453573 RepID=A0A4R4P6R4_9ACTN|nr:alpha/beta hydrolase [Actinomadura bangladeshensis]TDC18191.1 alpha/beta hydrolase [Actinomadura bangladeshensis]